MNRQNHLNATKLWEITERLERVQRHSKVIPTKNINRFTVSLLQNWYKSEATITSKTESSQTTRTTTA